MTVPVTEFKRLDTAGAGRHGVVEIVRAAGRESRLSVLFRQAVQGLESRS